MTLHLSRYFQKNFNDLFKKYKLDKDTIRREIENLSNTYFLGDIYPGIKPEVRKIRFALPSYNIGKSKGLRLVCMKISEIYCPILIYKKGDFGQESEVKKAIQSALSTIIAELQEES